MRITIAAGFLAVGLLLAGCGGSSDRATTLPEQKPSQAAAQGNKKLTQADLQSALLTVTDMPTGFTVDTSTKSSENDDELSGCAAMDSVKKQDGPKAEANFTKGSFGPFVGEELALLGEEQARKSMSMLNEVLAKCRTFTSKDDNGETVTVKLNTLSFPKIGDDTYALRVTLGSGGIAVDADVITIRRGGVLILITNAQLGSPDSQLTETVARKALAKVDAQL
ncbi:hypothetical protein C3Y87_09340 [Carbonactinospora thermoautotrophica]|uniref:hypothetical protein n=1 Tax=Carbonactinospora thermoautotrophica TaxID=1469144 RepID=UPI002270D310|nr:hypothetical protein [Carbonactinospora thermoautotrophica]MCX9191614.1 hypothetical protein [Carbonactinospora thermoautotrophica]